MNHKSKLFLTNKNLSKLYLKKIRSTCNICVVVLSVFLKEKKDTNR